MAKASRNKGKRGELEVAGILRAAGLDAVRTPNSGGLRWKGDVIGVPGYVVEVKRAEQVRMGDWLDQVHDAAGERERPMLAFRCNQHRGALSKWHGVLRLEDVAHLIAVVGPDVVSVDGCSAPLGPPHAPR